MLTFRALSHVSYHFIRLRLLLFFISEVPKEAGGHGNAFDENENDGTANSKHVFFNFLSQFKLNFMPFLRGKLFRSTAERMMKRVNNRFDWNFSGCNYLFIYFQRHSTVAMINTVAIRNRIIRCEMLKLVRIIKLKSISANICGIN